jgi:chemotaxis protein methyltransferase CheR
MAATSAAQTEGHEFLFTAGDFERISRLIHRHAGIALSASKKEMVYSRLARRLRAKGLTRFDEYLALLERGDDQEWEQFTNSLTTNLTAFFRETHHFPILAKHVRRRHGRPITLWCCAASTGEEPYSMAMTMAEAFDTLTPPVRILATDLDTQVLERARSGIYVMERLEKMPQQQVRRFFRRGTGANAGMVCVRPELRSLISFRQLNLLDESWPVRGPFDAIFCRNVMIYFDKPTQRTILERFAPLLAADGLLFAGHSESFHHAVDLFRPCGKTVYALQPGAVHA